MSGGKRFKFQDTTIQFATAFDADSPSGVITGITNANPAVVTQTAHGYSDGDIVYIRGIEGMTELEGEKNIIEVVNDNSYRLLGVNSTNYGVFSGEAFADVGAWSTLCELTGYNRSGGTSPDIPATTICSDAQEFEVGLPDFGSLQVDYNFAPLVTVQAGLQAAYLSGAKIGVKVTLPNSGGILSHVGYVQQTGEQAQVNGIWTASLTVRMTGQRRDFEAA